MRSSNVQGFVSRVLTLYEEEEEEEWEEDCAPLYGYRRIRSSIFTFQSSVAEYTTLCYSQMERKNEVPRRRHIKKFYYNFINHATAKENNLKISNSCVIYFINDFPYFPLYHRASNFTLVKLSPFAPSCAIYYSSSFTKTSVQNAFRSCSLGSGGSWFDEAP